MSSAGTRAVVGRPMHPAAARILERLGGDPSDFSARQINRKIAEEADLILTMTRVHRDTVLELAPRQLRRTFTLHEAAWLATNSEAKQVSDLTLFRSAVAGQRTPDIPDPIGHDDDFHSQIGLEIASLLAPILTIIQKVEPF